MKKKPIIISALGLLLCLSLVLTTVFHSPMVAFAAELPEDCKTSFVAGDAFRVIGWYGDWTGDYPKPTDERWINSKLTYNGSKWKTDPYMRWQNTDESRHFLGVWPYNLVDSNTDLTSVAYNTLTAAEKDVLVARTTLTDKPANNTVPLEFDHLMSRFDVNLTFANRYQAVSNVSVKVNVGTDATINLIANTITLGNEQNDVTLDEIDTAEGMAYSRSGILIPQTSANAVVTVSFTADGEQKTATYVMPELKLESGKSTTLNLLVGDDKIATITFDTDGGSAVSPITQECGTAVTAPANPTRTGYTFIGWSPSLPTTMPEEDITVKAMWQATGHTIVWKNWDGTVLKTDYNVAKGTIPAFNNNPPVKKHDEQYVYNFIGWTPAVVAVTGDATYTATFETIPISEYTYQVGDKVVASYDRIAYCSNCGRLLKNYIATITGVRGVLDGKIIYWVTYECCGHRASMIETEIIGLA